MSRISYLASMKNSIENNKMLAFANEVLDEENFMKIYKSYRQLFWFQVSFPIAAAIIIIIACIVFNQYIEYVILFGSMFFLIGFVIWLILSQFVAGKLWHKYVRWYKKRSNLSDLYKLLDKY